MDCCLSGRAELYKVLKAYSVHNPADGYCQAQVKTGARRTGKLRSHISGSTGGFVADEHALGAGLLVSRLHLRQIHPRILQVAIIAVPSTSFAFTIL